MDRGLWVRQSGPMRDASEGGRPPLPVAAEWMEKDRLRGREGPAAAPV